MLAAAEATVSTLLLSASCCCCLAAAAPQHTAGRNRAGRNRASRELAATNVLRLPVGTVLCRTRDHSAALLYIHKSWRVHTRRQENISALEHLIDCGHH